MNLAFIIGVLGAFGLVVYGILDSGSLMAFYDFPSIVITIGGTLMAVVACFPFKDLAKIPKHFPIILGVGKHKWKAGHNGH